MSRQKQRKFRELAEFSNFIANPFPNKGHWQEKIFKNNNPLILELGCGKGEFCNQLGKMFPQQNFIGIDIDGARLWRAGKNAMDANLKNVVFTQLNIDKIEESFDINEVDEIWIPFPDPYPKPSKWKKRLISTIFLERYSKILKPEHILHFKTDNTNLYTFAVNSILSSGFTILENTDNLYHSTILNEFNSIPSYFESIFMEKGETIKYIRFQNIVKK